MSFAAPKLRDDLIVSEQQEQGKTIYVVKHPETRRFFHLGKSEYTIMQLMSGERSLSEIRAAADEQHKLDVDAATLQGFVLQLANTGCLEVEVHGLEGMRQAGRRLSRWRILGNILYWRVGAINPERFINAVTPHTGLFFTPVFFGIAVISIISGILLLDSNAALFAFEAKALLTLKGLALLWIAILVTIGLHELAHGVTCTRYGGRVREMGFLMILMAFPCLFTNVSDAWLFPKKRQRLWVTASGVFFEAFLWSLAVFIWRVTAVESLVHHLALVVVTASGIGLFFSMNPLIKFDGYYFLSDLVEIPNLRSRSFSHLGRLLWQVMTGAPMVDTRAPVRVRRIYLVYGVMALAYTFLIIVMIVSMLGGFLWTYLGWLGAAISAGLIAFFMKGPIQHMAQSTADLAKESGGFFRRRRIQIWMAVIAALVTASFFVTVELRISGPFQLQATLARPVTSKVGAFIESVHVQEGQTVESGTLLVMLDATEVRSALAQAQASLRQAQEALKMAEAPPRREVLDNALATVAVSEQELKNTETRVRTLEDAAGSIAKVKLDDARMARDLAIKRLDAAKSSLDVLKAGSSCEEKESARAKVAEFQVQVEREKRRLANTRILAPIAGVIVTPRPERLVGLRIALGEPVISIYSRESMFLDISIPEKEIGEIRIGQTVRLKANSFPGSSFETTVQEIAPIVTPADPEAFSTNHVVVRCHLVNPDERLKPGMTGEAKVECGPRTIMSLFTRRVRRWLKVEFW